MGKYDKWRIKPIPGSDDEKQWKTWSKLQRIAWLWRETNAFILKFVDEFPDRCMRLRAEDLFEWNIPVMEQVYAHIGLPMPDPGVAAEIMGRKINKQRGGNFPLPDDWTDEMNRELEAVAGDMMKVLGYE